MSTDLGDGRAGALLCTQHPLKTQDPYRNLGEWYLPRLTSVLAEGPNQLSIATNDQEPDPPHTTGQSDIGSH
jgi:hypothetical protein